MYPHGRSLEGAGREVEIVMANFSMTERDTKPGVIGYVVPMGKGLDSFVYREIEQLTGMGLKIVLFSTKYKKHDIFSPKTEWPCFVLSPLLLLLLSPLIMIKALIRPGLFLHAIRYKSLVELAFALHYAPKMLREKISQIHCHFGDRKLFVGYYCKRITGLPLSVTIHSHELHVNPNEKLFRMALQECDRIFAISQLAVDLLVTRYSAPRERVVLNRLFLDMSIWSDTAPVRVITVGRFEPQKGFDYLFKAAAQLKDLSIEFVVVGFGPLDVKALAKEIGVQDQIIFFDKLDQTQLRLLYQSCDIYCLPSISHPEQGMEGIPVVLMEAMACGLPVVATRAGAVSEIVKEILVDEKSPEALASAIRYLAEHDDVRILQGQSNRELVACDYSIRNIQALYDGLRAVGARVSA
jgi:glycosyltransferase involved in cell wall biosynthesis